MKIICIVGPTACYKSQTAISLAKRFKGEILSCDSVSVYKGFDIGSAKPSPQEQKTVPHHLIDIADPFDLNFTVSVFQQYADDAIRNCFEKNATPVLAGGSGMYYDAVLHPMTYACPSDAAVRDYLSKEYDADPLMLQRELRAVDSIAADRIPLNDKKRLVRALEVYKITGSPFSSFLEDYRSQQAKFRYRTLRIGLSLPREMLYARIEQRVDAMLQAGLVKEVEELLARGLSEHYPAMQSIGYHQIMKYLHGQYTLEYAVDEIKKATRHLAKRQFTWFRRDSGIRWFDCTDYNNMLNEITQYVEQNLNEQ